MSAAVAYDTLKIARQLTQAGLEPKVAEGVSETFAGILGEREDALATKADLKGEIGLLRTELKSEMGVLRSELKGEMGALRSELKGEVGTLRSELKGEVGALRTELKGDIALVRGEVQALRHEMKADFRAGNVDLIKWMFGGMLAFAGALFAAIKLF